MDEKLLSKEWFRDKFGTDRTGLRDNRSFFREKNVEGANPRKTNLFF